MQGGDGPHHLQRLPALLELPSLRPNFGDEVLDLEVERAVGEEAEGAGQGAGQVVSGGGGEGAAGKEVGEFGAVGEDVGPHLVLDAQGADLEAVDQEAEVGGGKRGGLVELAAREEVANVDGAREDVHGVDGRLPEDLSGKEAKKRSESDGGGVGFTFTRAATSRIHRVLTTIRPVKIFTPFRCGLD